MIGFARGRAVKGSSGGRAVAALLTAVLVCGLAGSAVADVGVVQHPTQDRTRNVFAVQSSTVRATSIADPTSSVAPTTSTAVTTSTVPATTSEPSTTVSPAPSAPT